MGVQIGFAGFRAGFCTGTRLHESYQRYVEALAGGINARYGLQVEYLGDAGRALVAEDGQAWDMVVLVRYPNRQAFADMIRDPRYRAVSHFRSEALVESVLQPATPIAALPGAGRPGCLLLGVPVGHGLVALGRRLPVADLAAHLLPGAGQDPGSPERGEHPACCRPGEKPDQGQENFHLLTSLMSRRAGERGRRGDRRGRRRRGGCR